MFSKPVQTDLAILTATLTGITAGAMVQTSRHQGTKPPADPAIIAAFVATTSITRHVGRLAGLYPDGTAVLAGTALSVGLLLGFVSSRVGKFLPKIG